MPSATVAMVAIRTARASRDLRVTHGAPPEAIPIASTVEQSPDQHFDFVRDAVRHERVTDGTALPREVGTLGQGYGGGDAFRGGSRSSEVSVQFDPPVVFGNW